MTDRHDGGPAFPIKGRGAFDLELVQAEGMSLRDYFAGQALAGLMGNPDFKHCTTDEIVMTARHLADAMLAARSEAKP